MTHIFASDYDGTLYHNKPITQEDLAAIHRFRSKGYKFGIVTGRSINSIFEEALELANVINERFNKNDIRCFSNNQYIDVGTINNSKTTGIDDVVNLYKYQGQIYTVGDSYNDVPMLRNFFGFLMGNGVLSLEKFAKGGIVESVAEAIDKAIIQIEGDANESI